MVEPFEDWDQAIDLLEREGLADAVLTVCRLLSIDDKPETRQRWTKLEWNELFIKAADHLTKAGEVDDDTGFDHAVNATARALMLISKTTPQQPPRT